MKLNFKWTKQTGQYQNGEDCTINGIAVGSLEYNSTMSRDLPQAEREAKQYRCFVALPARLGYEYKSHYAPTPDKCHEIVEGIITKWFDTILKENV